MFATGSTFLREHPEGGHSHEVSQIHVGLRLKATKDPGHWHAQPPLPQLSFAEGDELNLFGYVEGWGNHFGWGAVRQGSGAHTTVGGCFPLQSVHIATTSPKDLDEVEEAFDVFPLIPITAAEGVRAFLSANDVVEFLATIYPSMILKVGVAKSRLLERLQAKQELEMKGLSSAEGRPSHSSLMRSSSTGDLAPRRSHSVAMVSHSEQLVRLIATAEIEQVPLGEEKEGGGGGEDNRGEKIEHDGEPVEDEGSDEEGEFEDGDQTSQEWNHEGDFNKMTVRLEEQVGSAIGLKEMRLLQFLMFQQHAKQQSEAETAIDVDAELRNLREQRQKRLDYFAQKLDSFRNKLDLAEERRLSGLHFPHRPDASPAEPAAKQSTDYSTFNHPSALELFKEKPSKGVKFMIDEGLVASAPEEVARLLYNCVRVDKVAKGDFLGEPDDFNMQVLAAFSGLFNFHGLDFDIALRRFLYSFRLPGEAQKIDRIMNAFAMQYYSNNPKDVFKNSDAVYVLAFSVVMLNTDAHNPRVEVKMSQADFIKNTSKINDGEDLPPDYLADLYNRIVANEIKMDHPTYPNAMKMGWMWTKRLAGRGQLGTTTEKEKGLFSGFKRFGQSSKKNPNDWRKLWFIYETDGRFLYFDDAKQAQPLGVLTLDEHCTIEACGEEENKKMRLEDKNKKPLAWMQKSAFSFRMNVPPSAANPAAPDSSNPGDGTILLTVQTKREMDSWLFALSPTRRKRASASCLLAY